MKVVFDDEEEKEKKGVKVVAQEIKEEPSK